MEWRNGVAAAAMYLCAGLAFAAPAPPVLLPQDNVIDLAEAISPATKASLGGILRGYTQATGFEMTVITVAELDGESLDAYARRALYERRVVDEDAGTVLLLWAPTPEFVVAASPVAGAYLSQEQIAQVLDAHAPRGLTADTLGAGLIQVTYGLMMAVQQTWDSPSSPQELVFATQWDLPDGNFEAPAAVPDLEDTYTPHATDSHGERRQGHAGAWIERVSDPSRALEIARLQARHVYAEAQDGFGRMQRAVEGAGSPGDAQRLTKDVVVAILCAVALLALLGVWRASRSPGFAVSLAALAAATALWVLADFVELAVLTLIVGQLIWVGLVLLPHLLARSQDARIQTQGRVVSGPGLARPITTAAASTRPVVPAAAPRSAPKPTATQPSAAQPPREPVPTRSLQELLDLAHQKGVATPALAHLVQRREALKTPQLQAQRRNWLVAIGISFFILFPLALGLALVWAISELNRLKPEGQPLPVFLRQLLHEVKAVGQLRQH